MHFNGLSDKEAAASREKYGSNLIPDSEPTTFWAEFKETFGDPMIRILLAIAAMMIVMWVFNYADIYEPLGTIVAVLIVAFVSAKTGVASDTKYRELKDSTKKDQCKAYRNGVISVIDVDDVVVGDKILLQSGDKVPADGVLVHGALRVDNSALNGEAEECKKTAAEGEFHLADEITGDTFLCGDGSQLCLQDGGDFRWYQSAEDRESPYYEGVYEVYRGQAAMDKAASMTEYGLTMEELEQVLAASMNGYIPGGSKPSDLLYAMGELEDGRERSQVCLDTFYAVILHNQRLVTSPEEVREGGNSTLYIGFYLPELEMADLTNCNAGSNTQWTFQEKTA